MIQPKLKATLLNPIKMPAKFKFMQKLRRPLFSGRGFTLVEIMATVAILSFGMLAIYESFYISIDAFGYYTNYLNAQWWLNEKIWGLESQLMENEYLMIADEQGTFNTLNKDFGWSTSVKPLDENKGVYKLDVGIFWQEGNRERFIYRSTYATRQLTKELEDES